VPLYEYECDACGQRFEIIEKFSDLPAEACKFCGKGPVRRLVSSPAIQFKGSGWYITDYAQKGKSDSSSTTKEQSGSDASKSDSATPDAGSSEKTDTTTSTRKTDTTTSTKSDTAASTGSSSTGGKSKE
jgi:putative FmdB family regulatory protein